MTQKNNINANIDILKYCENHYTLKLEKKIMKRIFNTFDVLNQGYLDKKSILKLCNYLSEPMNDKEKDFFQSSLFKEKIYFDDFFNWWNEHCKISESNKILSMVSGKFDVPFHHHQLIINESGEKYTDDYRIKYYLKNLENGNIKQISPWHDIPLYVKDFILTTYKSERNKYNFICEIPKWTRAKFEICTNEDYNPIKQDIKNGVPRFYKHGDMMWNYGAFPQTWESNEILFLNEYKGDKDPVDAIEIGSKQINSGIVCHVKILGVLGMIDDGEMDWKVICISHSDPMATYLDEIEDVYKYLPGCLEAIREWLRTYKICQGGVENKFAFNGEYQNKKYAMKLINESHRMWAHLKKVDGKEQL